MTLYATPAMQRAFEDALNTGKVTKDAYVYAVVKGYSRETKEKLRAKLHENAAKAKVSLAIAGAPIIYREPEEVRNPSDPTPQWLEKAGRRLTTVSAGRGELIGAKRFRLRHVLDQYGKDLGETKKMACERFLFDAVYALRVRIANWQPSGGGTPNPIGGLGNVQPHVRVALQRHEWVMRFLSDEAKLVAKALVTGEVSTNNGSALTPKELGARMMPEVRNLHRLWGLGMGALWLLSSQLVHLYGECPYEADPYHEAERDAELGYEPRPRQRSLAVMPQ